MQMILTNFLYLVSKIRVVDSFVILKTLIKDDTLDLS